MVYIVISAIMGIGLIIFQILSIIGNVKTGGLNFFSTGVNLYEIFYFLGCFILGFIGLFCIIVAIKDYRKLKNGKTKKINECEISQGYAGKPINFEKLSKLFHANGNHEGHDEYIVYCEQFEKEECALFNIPPTLKDYWGYSSIRFWIYLYVDNGKVFDCRISKDKCTGGYNGRPSVQVLLSPTQQEISIFRRVMDYITE